MQCTYCGEHIGNNDNYFHCNIDNLNYCCAECAIDSLIEKGRVEVIEEGYLLYNGFEYRDRYDLMKDIGDYKSDRVKKNTETFETPQAAVDFANKVGGTWGISYLPDYMGTIQVYVVEWEE